MTIHTPKRVRVSPDVVEVVEKPSQNALVHPHLLRSGLLTSSPHGPHHCTDDSPETASVRGSPGRNHVNLSLAAQVWHEIER